MPRQGADLVLRDRQLDHTVHGEVDVGIDRPIYPLPAVGVPADAPRGTSEPMEMSNPVHAPLVLVAWATLARSAVELLRHPLEVVYRLSDVNLACCRLTIRIGSK